MKQFLRSYLIACIIILRIAMPSQAQVSDTTLQGFSPFPFGAAVNVNLLKSNAQYRNLVTREFNSLTPENAMKFGVIHPSQFTYFWKDADTLVNFAQLYNKRVHGHTLIWHNNIPSWVTNFVGDSTAWEDIFRTHIQTVVGHYAGRVSSWDVVNEVFNDDGTMRSSVWLDHLGPNYIARAFQYAHAADPAALLFYNDYGHEYSTAKLLAIQNLANSLVAAGVPINGLGMQLHVNKFTANNNISVAIDSMLATGLKIHIAELDVAMNPENNLSLTYNDILASQQFGKFKFISRLAKNMAPGRLYGITTWNVTDADSWIPGNYSRPDFPLPFNSSYQKKLAYLGIKDALTSQWNYDVAHAESVAGTYVDLGTSGTLITTGFTGNPMGSDNDNSSIQEIGFNFVFNGSTYTQFVLNTNGYIKLGASAPTANNIFYPTASGNTGSVITTSDIDLIYPYNHDLKSGTSTAQYRVQVLGSPGSRVCTIQFKNVADKIAPIQYNNMEFQVKLYETSNNIEFVYGTWTASANASTLITGAVGVKGINAAESVNLAKGSSVSWTTPLSLANNMFFRSGDYPLSGPQFSTRNAFLPDAGRTFRFSTFSVVPVGIENFAGQKINADVQLQWNTATEINNKNFELQRSVDGMGFKTIAVVDAKPNSINGAGYAFTDGSVPADAVLYYRLKQNDLSGRTTISPVIKINNRNNSRLEITATNPFNEVISLQIQSASRELISAALTDMNGRIILQQQLAVPAGSSSKYLSMPGLSAGVYLLTIHAAEAQQTIKLVKQ